MGRLSLGREAPPRDESRRAVEQLEADLAGATAVTPPSGAFWWWISNVASSTSAPSQVSAKGAAIRAPTIGSAARRFSSRPGRTSRAPTKGSPSWSGATHAARSSLTTSEGPLRATTPISSPSGSACSTSRTACAERAAGNAARASAQTRSVSARGEGSGLGESFFEATLSDYHTVAGTLQSIG